VLKSGAEQPRFIKSQGDFILALQILGGPERCLDSIGDINFFEYSIKMGLHRMRTDAKFVSNFIIGRTYGNLGEYLDLSLC